METLKIKRDNVFRIPIEDIYGKNNGDYIEFDLEDISLQFRCMEAVKKREEILKKVKAKEQTLKKKMNSENAFETTEEILSLWNDAYNDMREVMDCFLGKGTCQKIFHDKNYISMFDDLSKALEPYMEQAGLTFNKTKEKIQKKYGNKNKEVI